VGRVSGAAGNRSPWGVRLLLVALCLGIAALAARRWSAGQGRVAPAPTATGAVGHQDAGARVLRGKPKRARELPTTSADIFLGNLDEQIGELTRLTREHPELVANLMLLSTAHHSRGRLKDDLDEIQLGIDETTQCIALAHDDADTPKGARQDAKCYLMRAEQEQSLHRFGEARADLARARELGADEAAIADLETELDWNAGLYEASIPKIRAMRLRRPSTSTWIREAQLEHDLGHEMEADLAFEAAEDWIRDTNPLIVAHLDVQRGIQKVHTGKLDDAILFFREATARVPTHIAALEHLAETLGMAGRHDEAAALYEKVVALSDDPEFSHALATEYALIGGREKETAELEAKAKAGYARLVTKYPEAMYWHASEYYMATGDVARALDLLRKNVTLRPGSPSFVALARAELANGRKDDAKASIDKALAMPLVSADLFATASRVYRAIGDAKAADAFRARAAAIDPRVAAE
jgi:tetratricopeptide (TPR) repeat protein